MANTVQANIEVKANMNTSSVDDGIRTLIAEFNKLSKSINESVNSGLILTDKEISKLGKEVQSLFNNKLFNDENIYNTNAMIKDLTGGMEKIVELRNAFKMSPIIEEFNKLSETIENAVNYNLVLTDDELNKLKADITSFSENKSFNDYIYNSKELLTGLADNFELLNERKKALELGPAIEEFNRLSETLEKIVNGNLIIADDQLVKLTKDAEALKNNKLFNDENIYNANILINDITEKINEILDKKERLKLESFWNTELDKGNTNIIEEQIAKLEEYKNINEYIDKELDKVREQADHAKTLEMIEALEKEVEFVNKVSESMREENEFIDKILDTMQKEAEIAEIQESFERLAENGSAFNLSKEESQIDDIEESFDRLTENGSVFNTISEDVDDMSDSLGNNEEKVKDYSKLIELLVKKIGLTNNEAVKFAQSLGATAKEAMAAGVAIGAIVAILKIYNDRLKEAEKALISFSKGAFEVGVNGIETFVDGIHSLIETIDDALDKMKDFADAGADIQTSYFNTFEKLGSEAGNSIISFTEDLERLYGLDGAQLIGNLKQIVFAASDLGVSTGDMVKATKNMTLMANDLSMLAGDFSKAADDIGQAVEKGFISRNSSLWAVMTKKERDELKSLSTEIERYNYLIKLSDRIKGRYNDYLNTEAGRLRVLNNQYDALKSNIQLLALGLYAKIAPVLTKLIQLANTALTFIMKVFNLNLKGSADNGTGSVADNISDSIEGVGDSAKKTGKEVDKLKKQVASFDDVIQINDNKNDSDLSTSIKGLSDIDLSAINNLDDSIKKLTNDWDKFRELLEDGKYYEAGFELANQLSNMMRSIPWDDFQDKAKKAGKSLAEFLNGFVDNKTVWYDFGNTIAQSLNTAVDFLLEFAKEFDFQSFGDSLGVSWNSFWENFDEDDAADALYEWFIGIFETLGGLFSNFPLSRMADSISQLINGFFENFRNDPDAKQKIADTIFYVLEDGFNAALILTQTAFENADTVIDILNTILDSAIEWLDNGGDQTIEDISKAIVGMLEKVKDSGLIEKVRSIISRILSDIKLSDILLAASEIALDVWAAKTKIKLQVLGAELLATIQGAASHIIGGLKDIFTVVFSLLAAFALKLWSIVTDAFGYVGENISGGLETIWALIQSGLMLLGDKISSLVSSIFEGIKTLITGIINWITDSLNKIWNWISGLPDKIIDKFNKLKNWDPLQRNYNKLGGVNVSMPWSGRHAAGGITNGASIGMIGEAGREAILPLDSHNEWMDTLVNKMMNANGGNNNTPVVIDMSKANKPVYTRSEYLAMADIFAEAMKARGIVVSMEY